MKSEIAFIRAVRRAGGRTHCPFWIRSLPVRTWEHPKAHKRFNRCATQKWGDVSHRVSGMHIHATLSLVVEAAQTLDVLAVEILLGGVLDA